jgi:Nicotianamine synthase protein
MISRADAIKFVNQAHETLSDQKDLSPNNPVVTRWAKRLVEFVSATHLEDWANHLPDAPELAKAAANLPLLCGRAECQMEKWWCRRLIASDGLSFNDLAEFWYFESYRSLVSAELTLLGPTIATHAIFLGSGALPLTAVLLARLLPGLRVQCVDSDPEACELSRALIRRLGMEDRTTIVEGRAEEVQLQSSDAVICASLLQAPMLYDALAKNGIRTVVIRDAEGLFRLCYTPASTPPIGYCPHGRTAACSSRINISRLFSLTGGSSQ